MIPLEPASILQYTTPHHSKPSQAKPSHAKPKRHTKFLQNLRDVFGHLFRPTCSCTAGEPGGGTARSLSLGAPLAFPALGRQRQHQYQPSRAQQQRQQLGGCWDTGPGVVGVGVPSHLCSCGPQPPGGDVLRFTGSEPSLASRKAPFQSPRHPSRQRRLDRQGILGGRVSGMLLPVSVASRGLRLPLSASASQCPRPTGPASAKSSRSELNRALHSPSSL